MLTGILSFLLSALAVYLTALIVPGISFRGNNRTSASMLFAFILALVNLIVRPVLAFLGAPITFITLGLFSLVINALMLMLASYIGQSLGDDGIEVDGFASALIGGIVLAIVNACLGLLL